VFVKQEDGPDERITNLVNSVASPPTDEPNTPPIGAPAAKVAKARDLALDGGNSCASIPSCKRYFIDCRNVIIKSLLMQVFVPQLRFLEIPGVYRVTKHLRKWPSLAASVM